MRRQLQVGPLPVLPTTQASAAVDAAKAGRLPAALTRRYDVYFVPEERMPLSEGERWGPGQLSLLQAVAAELCHTLPGSLLSLHPVPVTSWPSPFAAPPPRPCARGRG